MTGPARGWARVAPDEEGQLARLAAFRQARPEVIVGHLGFGKPWQARTPEVNGETIVTRYTLRELLDSLLGEVTLPAGDEPDGGGEVSHAG